ncbi:hypothetical protein FACS1894113_5440 [Alphaproteobacteria bacterium]|nr:hypothetical protein FACS1894113_5440 [Alphaproteobacteria bacterium]
MNKFISASFSAVVLFGASNFAMSQEEKAIGETDKTNIQFSLNATIPRFYTNFTRFFTKPPSKNARSSVFCML